jgi:enoyl-CoA hydratase
MSFENIRVERRDNVGIVTLDRPEVLNALSEDLMGELSKAVDALDADPEIRCLVLTGSDKAFAAGANIKEMQDKTYTEVLEDNFISGSWTRLARCRTPVVAAVAGYAIGGGCELVMMCDIVIAADTAKFGQPEITIGTIPAAGGTQRLPRLIGKAKAMELCLTGRMMDAAEAERAGLVSRVVPAEALIDEALKTAETVASMPASTPPSRCPCPRACASRAACFIPPSPRRTGARACRPSSKSARRSGVTAEGRGETP